MDDLDKICETNTQRANMSTSLHPESSEIRQTNSPPPSVSENVRTNQVKRSIHNRLLNIRRRKKSLSSMLESTLGLRPQDGSEPEQAIPPNFEVAPTTTTIEAREQAASESERSPNIESNPFIEQPTIATTQSAPVTLSNPMIEESMNKLESGPSTSSNDAKEYVPNLITYTYLHDTLFEDESTWSLNLVGSNTAEFQEVRKNCSGFKIDSLYAIRNDNIRTNFMDAVAKTIENENFKQLHWVWHSEEPIERTMCKMGTKELMYLQGATLNVGALTSTIPDIISGYCQRKSYYRRYIPPHSVEPIVHHWCSYRMLLCEFCETTDTIATEPHVYVQPNKRLIRPIYVVHFLEKPIYESA